jgi:c-di-GMP-binding flagellar brake protein YcgR
MEAGSLYRLSEPSAGGERKALARAKAELVDISATGMCVRTRAPLELGQEVRMVAVVAGERLTLDGEVVRVTETPEGREAGVRHFDQSGAHQAVMARVVNSLELQRRAAERASEAS